MIKAVLNPGERGKQQKFANVATMIWSGELQAVMSTPRHLNTISLRFGPSLPSTVNSFFPASL